MTKHLLICNNTMRCTIPRQTQHQVNDFLVIGKAKVTISLTKQMLGQIQMTCFDKEERPTNKIGKRDAVGSNNAKMTDKVVHESMCSTTSQSRSRIQSTQS